MTEAHNDSNDDLLAAEYVLGVLPLAERQTFSDRLVRELELRQRLTFWENHFAALNAEIAPVSPPAQLVRSIEHRLFGDEPPQPRGWGSPVFWRGLSFASLAALAVVTGLYLGIGERSSGTDGDLVAQLSGDTQAVTLAALYDSNTGKVRFNRVAGAPSPGRAFELWLIAGDSPPVSLGVLPEKSAGSIAIPDNLKLRLPQAVLAVSDEPSGGSPTGQPTGAVLATGKLNAI